MPFVSKDKANRRKIPEDMFLRLMEEISEDGKITAQGEGRYGNNYPSESVLYHKAG